jgi:hypothetical protein
MDLDRDMNDFGDLSGDFSGQQQQRRRQQGGQQRQQQQRQQRRQQPDQPFAMDQSSPYTFPQRHVTEEWIPGRERRVRDAIVAINAVMCAGFIAMAATTGYYSLKSRRFNTRPEDQNMLEAGFSASLAATLSSALCIGYIWKRQGRIQAVEMPLFIPLIIMLLAAVPAVATGVYYRHPFQSSNPQAVKTHIRQLMGFNASLAVVGVVLPWFCTAAVSHVE